MNSQTITIEQLHEIRKGEPLILEEQIGQRINIPMLWLFYDFDTSSYVLVRRTYDDKKVRSYNHIILDDLLIEDHAEEVHKIISNAIVKIKNGECLVLQSNKKLSTFHCSKPHN